jgi:hypothetical protein
MAAASLALRRALHDGLVGHAPLVAALGGPKIWDEPPRTAAFPYVTLGEARVSDWSTGSSTGHEHALTLHVWSRQGGQTEAQVVAGEIIAALEQVSLAPPRAAPRQPALRHRRHPPRGRWQDLARGRPLPGGDRAGMRGTTLPFNLSARDEALLHLSAGDEASLYLSPAGRGRPQAG